MPKLQPNLADLALLFDAQLDDITAAKAMRPAPTPHQRSTRNTQVFVLGRDKPAQTFHA